MTNEYARKLLDVYDAQRDAYERLLDAASRERQALADERPLCEIIELLRSKQELMRAIESLEQSIQKEKRYFHGRTAYLDPSQSLLLNERIDDLKQLIESIMQIEKENEDTILGHQSRPACRAHVALEERG